LGLGAACKAEHQEQVKYVTEHALYRWLKAGGYR
jgi:hypothetical protein